MVGFSVNYGGEVIGQPLTELVDTIYGKTRAGEPVSITLANRGDKDYTVELGAKIGEILLEEI